MTFSEAVKKNTEEKYQKLVSGESESITKGMKIASSDEYEKKSREFHKRLKAEETAVKDTLQSIKDKKQREQKAAADKRRQEEWARRQEENKIKAAKDKKKKTIIAIAVIAALILGIVLLVRGCNAKYSDDNVVISVVEKNVENSSSKNLYFTLVFEVENKGSLDVLQMVGNFKIYNTNGDCLLSDTLTLNGTLKPGNTLQYDVNFSLANNEKNYEIYSTDLSGLKMTYQLTMIEFEGYKEKEYKNSDVIVLCDVKKEYIDGVNASSDSYDSAVALFNQGKYAEALPLFKALGDYKDSNDYYIKSVYHNALNLFSQEKYGEAYSALKEINGYEDTGEKMSEITEAALAKAETVAATGDYLAACKIIEQVDFDESSLLHQAYTYASQGYFADAVEYGLTVVVIPEGTEAIPDNYFKIEYGSNDLKKVVLPSSLKRIGTSAFYGCTKLEEINFPDGLQVIGNYAFFKCKSLKSVEIPSTVESMGSNVFQECMGLQSASIPGSLKTVPSGIFQDCSNLTTVTLKSGIEVLDIGAFSGCSSLTNITLPDSLLKIESSAFSRCTSLLEITIPANVNMITYSAFSKCSALQRVHFANQTGWQYEYSGSGVDVSNAQENAKALRSVSSSTWVRK